MLLIGLGLLNHALSGLLWRRVGGLSADFEGESIALAMTISISGRTREEMVYNNGSCTL